MAIITDKKPLVSAIIGTYNYGHYIEEAIDSILKQAFPQNDIEIIVVDDGSKDDTPERVKKYGDKIKYIYKENGGQASALNVGFENARGKILALLDADDYWHPNKIKYVVDEFERSDRVDVVYHYMNIVDDENRMVGTQPDSKIENEIYFERYPLQNYLKGIMPFCMVTAGASIRADCLKRIIPIPNDFYLYPDLYMELILPFHAEEFALIKKHLGYHRVHGRNTWQGKEKGKEIQIQRTGLEIKLLSLIIRYIDKLAEERGYDSTLLKMKFDSIILEKEILLYNLQGRKFKALKKAVLFTDPTLRTSMLYKIFSKISLVASITIPYSTYIWLRQKYRSSVIFTIVHSLR